MAKTLLHRRPHASVEGFLDNIQRGTAVMTGTTLNISITSVVMDKSIVLFSFESDVDDDNPDDYNMTVRIDGGTYDNVHFEREAAAGTLTIAWQVIEFKASAPIDVQSASGTMAGTVANSGISSVDLAHTFPILSYRSPAIVPEAEATLTVEITSATNVQMVAPVASTASWRYYTVECDVWDVYKYEFNTDDTTVEYIQAITSVTPSKSMIQATARTGGADPVDGQDIPTFKLQSATEFKVYRSDPNFDWVVKAYVIEGTGDFKSQRLEFDWDGTDDDFNIFAVNEDNSVAKVMGGWGGSNGNNLDGVSGTQSKITVKADFNSSNEINLFRDDGVDDLHVNLEIVEFFK